MRDHSFPQMHPVQVLMQQLNALKISAPSATQPLRQGTAFAEDFMEPRPPRLRAPLAMVDEEEEEEEERRPRAPLLMVDEEDDPMEIDTPLPPTRPALDVFEEEEEQEPVHLHRQPLQLLDEEEDNRPLPMAVTTPPETAFPVLQPSFDRILPLLRHKLELLAADEPGFYGMVMAFLSPSPSGLARSLARRGPLAAAQGHRWTEEQLSRLVDILFAMCRWQHILYDMGQTTPGLRDCFQIFGSGDFPRVARSIQTLQVIAPWTRFYFDSCLRVLPGSVQTLPPVYHLYAQRDHIIKQGSPRTPEQEMASASLKRKKAAAADMPALGTMVEWMENPHTRQHLKVNERLDGLQLLWTPYGSLPAEAFLCLLSQAIQRQQFRIQWPSSEQQECQCFLTGATIVAGDWVWLWLFYRAGSPPRYFITKEHTGPLLLNSPLVIEIAKGQQRAQHLPVSSALLHRMEDVEK